MTVVYLDSFLLINFSLNYLLLLATGKLSGEGIHKWRFALAALFGAVYAAFAFFPVLQFSLHPVYKVSVALIMILISFGGSRRLLRISAVFLALACAFCGGILAIEFLKGASYMKDGMVYSSLDVKGLLISAVFCYGVIALFFRRSAAHNMTRGELVKVEFFLNGSKLELTALQDSGNTLQDPVTGQQVLVAEGARLQALFTPSWEIDRAAMENPIAAMERLSGQEEGIRFRLLPYRAVGVDCGMLLAIRMDRVVVQEEEIRNQLVALSPTPLSDGGSYSALVGFRQG